MLKKDAAVIQDVERFKGARPNMKSGMRSVMRGIANRQMQHEVYAVDEGLGIVQYAWCRMYI